MRVALGIVAHHARADQAHKLMEDVGAQYMSMDNGTLGCHRNHRKVWDYLATQDTDYSIVLEDDAEPVEGFREQLEQALTAAPAPIVSLYLGVGRPQGWQKRIDKAIKIADNKDAHWLTGKHVLHAVGLAIRTELLPMDLDPRLQIDHAITKWRRAEFLPVAYTFPSLVDHRDEPTLFDHGDGLSRTKPRKAWRVGTRDTWTDSAVPL